MFFKKKIVKRHVLRSPESILVQGLLLHPCTMKRDKSGMPNPTDLVFLLHHSRDFSSGKRLKMSAGRHRIDKNSNCREQLRLTHILSISLYCNTYHIAQDHILINALTVYYILCYTLHPIPQCKMTSITHNLLPRQPHCVREI